jgi:TRAP transporter TAXI family solute receptor
VDRRQACFGEIAMMGYLVRIVTTVLALFIWPRAALPAEPHWPSSLVIGTAAPDGTYAVYGEGLARILTRELGLPVATRLTEGPVENVKLLEAGEIQLAFVTMGVALQGWNGTGEWTGGRQFRTMRALFPMYETVFQIAVPRNSLIQSVADLNGKRVGVGPQGGTTSVYAPEIFKALKVAPALSNGEWADLINQAQGQALDAMLVAGGVPFPALLQFERQGVRYLPLNPQQTTDVRLAIPELAPSIVPAGVYPSLNRGYQTVGVYNFAVARSDLPDDLAYAIVDVVFSHQDELIEAHPAAAETVPARFTRNTFLPFHGGATRWYSSQFTTGVDRGD